MVWQSWKYEGQALESPHFFVFDALQVSPLHAFCRGSQAGPAPATFVITGQKRKARLHPNVPAIPLELKDPRIALGFALLVQGWN
jgi:hypothetical protein